MKGKTNQHRDGIQIGRLWKWGMRDGKAELTVWETHPPCDPGDVSLVVESSRGGGATTESYIRLTPDQQKTLGEWLLGCERLCLVCGAMTACMTEADLKPGDPGVPCTFDPTPRELWDALDAERTGYRLRCQAVEKERDAWRREASTLAFKMEDLQHEVGALQEQIRRIKGYINSIGG